MTKLAPAASAARPRGRSLAREVRVTLLVFVIAVLALTGGSIAFLSFHAHLVELATLQGERSRAAAIEVDAYVEDLVRKMGYLSRVRGLTDLPPEQQQRLLEALLRHNSAYDAVALADRTGSIVVQSSQYGETKTFGPAAASPPFVRAFEGGEDFVGPVEIEAAAGGAETEAPAGGAVIDGEARRRFLIVAVPAHDREDRVAGALLARVDLAFLQYVVSEVEVGRTGYAYIVDNRGYVVAERGPQTDALRKIDPAIGWRLSSDVRRYRGLRGENVVGAAALVRSARWRVVVELPTDEAFLPLRQSLLAIAAALPLVALAAVAMGAWFSKHIVRPIGRLTAAAAQVEAGNLEVEVSADERNELGALAHAFNRMTGQVRTLVHGLEDAQRRATFLASVGAELAGPLGIEEVLARLTRLTMPLLSDVCVIDLVERGGAPRRSVFAQVDPEREPILRDLAATFPAAIDPLQPAARAMERGCSVLIAESALDETSSPEDTPLRAMGVQSVLAVPLAARGQIIGAITLCSCTPDRRYGSADLALAEELARRASLAIDSAQLFARAQEAVRARDLFLSVASHELRGPITTLQLRLQTALRAVPADVSVEALWTTLQVADRQTQKLTELIASLLDLSRIAAGRLVLDREELDLRDVVRDVCQRLEPESTRVGSTVALHMSAPTLGRWDRLRMEQVVSNLLGNALRYAGGRPVEVEVEPLDHRARLRVRDHGPGIAAEARAHIFERFERATSETRSGGLGLGLYIVRQIVEAHGGTITVESEVGVGSTFTVELPCVVSEAGEPSHGGRAA